MNILLKIIRILLGCIFLSSAIFKLISIDEFELYIYSHNFLSLNLSFIAARLVISFEFFIGIMLILNFYKKQIWWITLLTLAAFTIYLTIVAISGVTDNCHCFGEIVKMTPIESIIKNVVLIILLLFIYKGKGLYFKYKFISTIILAIASIAIPLILSPPDFLYKNYYSKLAVVNEDGLESIILNEETTTITGLEGKKVLCFYSTSCHYCQLAEKKMSSIIERHDLDANYITNIFWGKSDDLNGFFSDESINFENIFIPVTDFFSITEGKMPLIILLDNKKVVEKFGYRNIDEKTIANFLKK